MDKRKASILLTAFFIDVIGPRTAMLNVLIAVIAIDYLTGVLRAIYERRLDSRVGARGIIKKIGYLTAIALAHQIDVWLGTGDALRSLSLSLFIANEAWSNIENLASMGIVFPQPVLARIKEMMGKEQLEDERKED
jgi:toxin secretion/phage lysis holin